MTYINKNSDQLPLHQKGDNSPPPPLKGSDPKFGPAHPAEKNQETLIQNTEDIINLSTDAIEAYVKDQTLEKAELIIQEKAYAKKYQELTKNLSGSASIKTSGDRNYLLGTNNNDLLAVIGNSNKLIGGDGNDSLFAAGSSNSLDTGTGNDEIAVSGNGNKINDSALLTENQVGKKSFAINGKSNITYTGDGKDTIILAGSKNRVFTGDDEDFIFSKSNSTIIESGQGDDVIISVGERQSIRGGGGDDVISSTGSGNIYGNDGDDVLDIKGALNSVYGGKGDDVIRVYEEANNIFGEEGNDIIELHALKGKYELNGNEGIDTLRVKFNAEDYKVVNYNNSYLFFNSGAKEDLDLNLNGIEFIQYEDGSVQRLSDLSKKMGDQLTLSNKDPQASISNQSGRENSLLLKFDTDHLISLQKTSNGSKLSYTDEQGNPRSTKLNRIQFIELNNGKVLNLNETPNFEYLDIDINNSLAITIEEVNGSYQTQFYDLNEDLLLKISFQKENVNFLFKDGSLLSAQDLIQKFPGNTTKTNPLNEETTVATGGFLRNVAELSIDTDQILKIEKLGNNRHNLIYQNKDKEEKIFLKDISFIETKEGTHISLDQYDEELQKISDERSHVTYRESQDNSEFKRIAYNITQDISFIENYIDGDYLSLSDEKKAAVQELAIKFEEATLFTTDRQDRSMDLAAKKIFSLRISNLLKNNNDVFEEVLNLDLKVHFSQDRDLGGTPGGFITGFAEVDGLPDNANYTVQLTFSTFFGGVYDGEDGDNVGIHEFTHILDFMSLEQEGLPFAISQENTEKFKATRDELFDQSNRNGLGILRDYGFSDNFEFLSVAVENYYERPNQLKNTSEELFAALSDYFKS